MSGIFGSKSTLGSVDGLGLWDVKVSDCVKQLGPCGAPNFWGTKCEIVETCAVKECLGKCKDGCAPIVNPKDYSCTCICPDGVVTPPSPVTPTQTEQPLTPKQTCEKAGGVYSETDQKCTITIVDNKKQPEAAKKDYSIYIGAAIVVAAVYLYTRSQNEQRNIRRW